MNATMYCVLFLFLLVGFDVQSTLAVREMKCQEITIPMCKGIGYNLTYMPNQFNHDTQEEAGLEVSNVVLSFLLIISRKKLKRSLSGSQHFIILH